MFAGAGGWDLAAEELGWEVDGVEIMPEAQATRAAYGLKTVLSDVRDFRGAPGTYDIVIASPPCQTFSMAGQGVGRAALNAVYWVIRSYRNGHPIGYEEATDLMEDERTALVVEPLRVVLEAQPTFVAWEQVPTVLPVWEACAEVLRDHGYSAATGYLHAEQFGVPQVRKRAILVARRDGAEAAMPQPTHSRFYAQSLGKVDPGLPSWVTMADELGWGMTSRPYPTIACARTTGGPDMEKVGGAHARKSIYIERDKGAWISHPVHTDGRCRLSMEETARLQTFPPGYPFQGIDRKKYEQIGNAFPPRMARPVLETFLGER
ncbi:DNA cytosine methyltransferase [Actinoplanes sp. CA-054009]